MAVKRTRHGGSGTKKYGRNEVKCKIYLNEHRREKNKLRKLLKLIKKHPRDKKMLGVIENLKKYGR